MKKIIVLFMTIMAIALLVGCEQDSNVLKVGMDLTYPPHETVDENGDPTGISVTLAEEFGKYLGREVQIVDVPFGSLITELNIGTIDVIIGSMTITEERALSVDFSNKYFNFPLVTLVNKTFFDDNNIETKEDLLAIEGVKFVAPKSFATLDVARELANNPIIREANDVTAAVLEVVTGASDVFLMSVGNAAGQHLANPDTTEILMDPIALSPIGMAFRKDNQDLVDQANAFIAGLESDGVYDILRNLYNSVIDQNIPGETLDIYLQGIINEEE
ncbi:MAG: transporter substrate-binding domain-containing protein [Acholeplasmataceae bacterium]|nr:transporter substrate-binding domain-containing protein [Acholeplasmataceae bacterium]